MCIIRYLVVSASTLVLAVFLTVTYIWRKLSKQADRPDLKEQYWGPGKGRDDDTTIVPFKINVSKEALDDLHNRLRNAPPFTPPLEDANFRYGFNSTYLKRVTDFWLNEYDWAAREAYLNSLPQFKTQVGGLQLHFIHAKPAAAAGVRVVPLLLLHGWPGSVREFYELIPLLTTARAGAGFVFEVVAPSLPGYGFSEGAHKQGLGPAQIGVISRRLMERLGHKQFYVQGGDWGHVIGSAMATIFPESVLGFHTNMMYSASTFTRFKILLGSFFPRLIVSQEHHNKVYPMGKHFAQIMGESGYFHFHATKPDTVGTALRDSPIGLAAYILEKFSTWTNDGWRDRADGGLENKYSLTNLLDNVMIYWISGCITTSVRLYGETYARGNTALKLETIPCPVPTAIANFPKELLYVPEKLVRDKFPNLIQFTHQPRGGHFPAFEEPHLLADDMWVAFEKMQDFNRNRQ